MSEEAELGSAWTTTLARAASLTEAEWAKLPVVDLPEKLEFLFHPARYKVAYGGRGGAKSWNFARALVIQGAMSPKRILCARDLQNSMDESVIELLRGQIELLGLDWFYEVQKTKIYGRNGTDFGFEGLRHNVASIKSYEGADICWIEEARTVRKTSWDVLIPTIRKPGSEIWISFNPELAEDETYRRFVADPPTGAVVVPINYYDNPWFPDVLKQEAADLKRKDPDAYLTVWEGHCKVVLDGAIYANQVRAATQAKRFTAVPILPGVPVDVFFDLGRRDMTSIWFVQGTVEGFRLVHFYEARGEHFSHYLDYLATHARANGYRVGEVWLPHDARQELLASKRTIKQQAWDVGHTVRDVPNISIAEGIDIARRLFERCWFDETNCSDGLSCLRNYRYDVDPDTKQFSKEPLHDAFSHGADAFRYFAVASAEPERERPADTRPRDRYERRRREAEESAVTGWAA